MRFLDWLLNLWARAWCGHHFVRTRWDDGSYGLRCEFCLKPYPVTWNDVLQQSLPQFRHPPELPRPLSQNSPAWSRSHSRKDFPSIRPAA